MAGQRRHYAASKPAWEDVALMRSLNMAYQASLLPAGIDTTFYDIGRMLILWVSAFEILVHPGGSGQASCKQVFDLIERTPWAPRSKIGQAIHDTGGKAKIKRSFASWLYERLYYCRNDFIHGNPVDSSSLLLSTPQQSIFEYVALLYSIALTSFLNLSYPRSMPSSQDASALAYIVDHMTFMQPQNDTENALLTAMQPPAHPSRYYLSLGEKLHKEQAAGRQGEIRRRWHVGGLLHE
ncbi:MAG: hypothetical protein INF16_08250 [Methylobacterium sp.]|nr:hypothetical protein [Methylobacterium sp.]